MQNLPINFIGFEKLFEDIDRFSKSPKYPPHRIYEIEDNGDVSHVIQLAVSGFSKNELKVFEENSYIHVCGSKVQNTPEGSVKVREVFSNFAARDFQIKFKISDNVKVLNTKLEDGVLTIVLEEVEPQVNRRTYEIN